MTDVLVMLSRAAAARLVSGRNPVMDFGCHAQAKLERVFSAEASTLKTSLGVPPTSSVSWERSIYAVLGPAPVPAQGNHGGLPYVQILRFAQDDRWKMSSS